MSGDTVDTVVLDLDGTLVDSVPVHVLAWQAAFREVGIDVPSHLIHRSVGMGGDRLVAAVTDDDVEARHGDRLRELQPEKLDELFDRIVPTDGAAEMIATLRERGLTLVLASSSDEALTGRLLDLVEGAGDLLDAAIDGSDAEESKPSGQLVEAALSAVDAGRALLIGDAVWDVKAAQDAGVPCIGLLTGGVSEAELTDAGAIAVLASPRAILDHLRSGGSLPPAG